MTEVSMSVIGKRADRLGLAGNIGVLLGLALAANGAIFAFGWNQSRFVMPRWTPPGWAIGSVWVVLFVLFGIARWRLGHAAAELRPLGGRSQVMVQTARHALDLLVLLCLGYVFYAIASGSLLAALIGNIVTLAVAAWAARAAAAVSRPAALLIVPSVVWLAFAAVLTACSSAA